MALSAYETFFNFKQSFYNLKGLIAKIWNSHQPESRQENVSKFLNRIENKVFKTSLVVSVIKVILVFAIVTSFYVLMQIIPIRQRFQYFYFTPSYTVDF